VPSSHISLQYNSGENGGERNVNRILKIPQHYTKNKIEKTTLQKNQRAARRPSPSLYVEHSLERPIYSRD